MRFHGFRFGLRFLFRGWIACVSVLPISAIAASCSPIVLDELPLLFPDDSNLTEFRGVYRVTHQAETLASPVVKADRSWEKGRVYLYGNVVWDAASQQFAMWYSTPKPSSVLYATSRDGLTWEKPALSLFPTSDAAQNNIVFQNVHSPSIFFDEAEANPDRRYKMMAKGATGYIAAFSGDGVRWTSYPPSKSVPKGDDTLVLSFDPRTGEYLCYFKELSEIRGFQRRVVYLARSKDFVTWSNPELVFAPDDEDDDWAAPDQRTDVYNMSVYPHAGGFLGFPTMFRVKESRKRSELSAGQSPDDGTIDVQLISSPDGLHWSRITPRTNLIARGALGEFDRGAILGLATQPVRNKAETWIYYTAVSTTHGAPIPPKEISIGRAAWRLDGFVSLDAEASGGSVETKPLWLANPYLLFNADASKGTIRVALLNSDGSVIPSYGLADCFPLTQDGLGQFVRWKTEERVPTDRPVRVLVEMSGGTRLFSVSSLEK